MTRYSVNILKNDPPNSPTFSTFSYC